MSKDFTANRKRLIILICSFTVLLISSLIYIIDEDIIKLLFSGTSATYAVNLVYNNVLLVFSFAFLVIIFAFLSLNKTWAKYFLVLSFACWIFSQSTYAEVKDRGNIVVGISIIPLFSTDIDDYKNVTVAKFDIFQRKKLRIALEE